MSDRLGLVGRFTNPVAQLLEDLPAEAGTAFVEMRDPGADMTRVDRVLVLSHQDALAHLPSLIDAPLPVRILLRRNGLVETLPEWQIGMDVFADAIRTAQPDHIALVALSQEAADILSARIDLPVAVLGQLPALPSSRRPRVAVRRDDPLLTFTLDTADGKRELRRGLRDVYNWTRLRRLGDLIAGDSEDEDMRDLCVFARGVEGVEAPALRRHAGKPTIISIVPNGVGLGHVTRMMAIGKALQKTRDLRMVFWSYSRAAEILQAAGFEVILRQNAVHLKAHPPHWRQWETAEFARTLQHLDARMISYDGGTFDQFVIDALRQPGCGRVGVLWVRRGMMRPETDAQMLEAEQYCDLVLEPGDLAVAYDKGPTRQRKAQNRGFSQKVISAPMTLKPYLPAYTRRQSKRMLKLGWERHCLVSLGGAFGDWSQLRSLMDEKAKRYRVRLIWAKSPLAPPLSNPDPSVKIRQFYPLSRYLAAFDGIITATGYNSYHELMMGYDGPVLLAPTNNVRLDDQVARASYAGDQGWAQVVLSDELDNQAEIIDSFMKQVSKGAKVTGRPPLDQRDEEVADPIFDIFERYK